MKVEFEPSKAWAWHYNILWDGVRVGLLFTNMPGAVWKARIGNIESTLECTDLPAAKSYVRDILEMDISSQEDAS